MAIWSGSWLYRKHEVTIWQDPNRFRAMIWAKRNPASPIYSMKVRRMHGEDKARLLKRAFDWIDGVEEES